MYIYILNSQNKKNEFTKFENYLIILSSQIFGNRHRCCCYFLGRHVSPQTFQMILYQLISSKFSFYQPNFFSLPSTSREYFSHLSFYMYVLFYIQAVFMMIINQLKGLENTKSNLSKKYFYLLEVGRGFAQCDKLFAWQARNQNKSSKRKEGTLYLGQTCVTEFVFFRGMVGFQRIDLLYSTQTRTCWREEPFFCFWFSFLHKFLKSIKRKFVIFEQTVSTNFETNHIFLVSPSLSL